MVKSPMMAPARASASSRIELQPLKSVPSAAASSASSAAAAMVAWPPRPASLAQRCFPKRLTRASAAALLAAIILTIHLSFRLGQPTHHAPWELPAASLDSIVHGQRVSEAPIPLDPLEPFPITPMLTPPPPGLNLDAYDNDDLGTYAPGHSRGAPAAPWLAAIMCQAADAERRMVIRSTWMHLYRDVPFAGRFVVANPGPQWTDVVRAENRTFGDIIVLDHLHEDPMTGHTIKTLEFFKWLLQSGQRYAFVSKIDSDLFLNARAFWDRFLLPRLSNETTAVPGAPVPGAPVVGEVPVMFATEEEYAEGQYAREEDREGEGDDNDGQVNGGDFQQDGESERERESETKTRKRSESGDESRADSPSATTTTHAHANAHAHATPSEPDPYDTTHNNGHGHEHASGYRIPTVERTIIGQLYYSALHDLVFPHGSMYTLTWDMVELLSALQDEHRVVAGEDLSLAILMIKGRERAHMVNHSGLEKFDYKDGDARGDGTAWARRDTHPNAPEHALYGRDVVAVHNLKERDLWMKVAECFDESGLRPAPPPPSILGGKGGSSGSGGRGGNAVATTPFVLKWHDFWARLGLSDLYASRLERIPELFWRYTNGSWVCDGIWDLGRSRTAASPAPMPEPTEPTDVEAGFGGESRGALLRPRVGGGDDDEGDEWDEWDGTWAAAAAEATEGSGLSPLMARQC